eukprot:1233915-Pyramimonas_sp.AAC.1
MTYSGVPSGVPVLKFPSGFQYAQIAQVGRFCSQIAHSGAPLLIAHFGSRVRGLPMWALRRSDCASRRACDQIAH